MNTNFICVFDFEASSKKADIAQILRIGAVIIERNNLSIIDSFQSVLKPIDFTTIEDEYLHISRLTTEELEKAPSTPLVWHQFSTWVNKYNKSKGSLTAYDAPIPAGFDICNYDMSIVKKYCEKYGPWDSINEDQRLFHQIYRLDILQEMFFWFENLSLSKLNLDAIMEYTGVSEVTRNLQHSAIFNARITAAMLIKLLNAGRYLTTKDSITKNRRMELKGCLKGWKYDG